MLKMELIIRVGELDIMIEEEPDILVRLDLIQERLDIRDALGISDN